MKKVLEDRGERIRSQNYFKLRCILVKETCSDIFKNATFRNRFGEEQRINEQLSEKKYL